MALRSTSNDAKEQVLVLIRTLTPSDRDDIIRAIKAMNALAKHTPAKDITVEDVTGDHVIVLDAIVNYMQSRQLDLSGRVQLLRSNGMRAFKPKAQAVYDWIKPAGRRAQQLALLSLGAEILYEDMVKLKWAVTSRTMMAHVHRIPALLEREFPGYAQAGFLNLIMRHKEI